MIQTAQSYNSLEHSSPCNKKVHYGNVVVN